MRTNLSLIGILAINLALALTGDALAKVWAVTNQTRWFYASLGLGIITFISFMLVVRHGGLSVGSTIALILTMIGNVVIGLSFFKETLVPTQWVGIILGLIAVLLILRPLGN